MLFVWEKFNPHFDSHIYLWCYLFALYIYAYIVVALYLCGKLTFIFWYRYEEKIALTLVQFYWDLSMCVYYMQSILLWLPTNTYTFTAKKYKKINHFYSNIVGWMTTTTEINWTHTQKKQKKKKKNESILLEIYCNPK